MPLEDTRADGTDRRGTPGWVARPHDGPPPVPRPPRTAPHAGADVDSPPLRGPDGWPGDQPQDQPEDRSDPPGGVHAADALRTRHSTVSVDPDPRESVHVDEAVRVDEAVHADEAVRAEAVPVGTGPPGARRRSRAAWVLASLLVVALLVAGALSTYLWRTTDAWRASSDQWEALARSSASQLATTQDELAAAQDEVTETRVQLATAQDRITELADEKAQLGDDSAAQQQLVDYQERVSQAAGQVATALATCIDGQQQLIEYMEAADQYDPAELERFRQDVDALCAQATDANAQLQTELEQ